MKQHRHFICIFLLCLVAIISCQRPSTDGRAFDTLEPGSDQSVITVLHPAAWMIEALASLRDEGFIPQEGLIVVGVYHEDELTNFEPAKKLVEKNGLTWIQFHEIRGALDKDNLFRENECSADFRKIFGQSDAIIFAGGADIPPAVYGSKTSLLSSVTTPFRHYMELSFTFHLFGGHQDDAFQPLLESDPGMPVLALCLGAQTLNVGTGGTMLQDVWFDQYGKIYLEDVIALGKENWHKNPYYSLNRQHDVDFFFMHRIKLLENSVFCREMGFSENQKPYIMSGHHQMIDKLGKGIAVTATSLDGKVPEAIEHEKYPNVLGVQFHPEFSELYDPEEKTRIQPEDEPFSFRSVLEQNPPSYAFHKKLWAWFTRKMLAHHAQE